MLKRLAPSHRSQIARPLLRTAMLAGCLLFTAGLPATMADLADGLVAYYPFEGDLQDGVGTAHGTGKVWTGSGGGGQSADDLNTLVESQETAILAYQDGKIGKGVFLDGAGQYIATASESGDMFDFGAPDAPTGFTVSAWFRVDSFTKGWQALITKGEDNHWRVHRQGEQTNVVGNGGIGDAQGGATDVSDGTLHQVTLVSVPDDSVTLYVDGVVEATTGAPALEANGKPMFIGQNTETGDRTWHGLIDEVALWNRPLTEAEVGELWNSGNGINLGENLGLSDDTDGDGMPNIYETNNGLDPNVNDAAGDLDGDGLTNFYEFEHGLLPNDPDSDHDGLDDGVETNTGVWVSAEDTGTDPSKRDTDKDTLRDGVENPDLPFVNITQPGTDPNKEDSDGDGVRDQVELDRGSNPTDPSSKPGIDFSEGLVAYWPLDEDLVDLTGGGSDGELMGGAGDTPAFESGALGGALLLDGIGEYVVINPENEPLFDGVEEAADGGVEQTGITVSSWFKVNAFDKSWQALVAKGENNNWRIHRRDATSVLTGNGGSADVSQGTTAVDDQEWHHLALVSNPGIGVQFFVDGRLEGSAGPPTLDDNDQPMMLGENPDAMGRTWNGLIDDVAFWQRALGEDEVVALYQAGLSGKSLGDLVYGAEAGMPVVKFTSDAKMVSLDFITKNAAGLHGLEFSTDLKGWAAVEGATIENLGDSLIRATAARATNSAAFYRGALLGVPPIYASDFESGPDGWTATVAQGDTAWELGTPNVGGLTAAHSGVNAWGTNLDGPYGDLVSASLRSPLIDLTGAARPQLTFWYHVDTTEGAEGVQMKYLNETGDVEIFVSDVILWGQNTGWVEFKQTIPTAAREQKIIIEFTLLTDGDGPNGAGFYLDDLTVKD